MFCTTSLSQNDLSTLYCCGENARIVCSNWEVYVRLVVPFHVFSKVSQINSVGDYKTSRLLFDLAQFLNVLLCTCADALLTLRFVFRVTLLYDIAIVKIVV